jgi:hypothetical protein
MKKGRQECSIWSSSIFASMILAPWNHRGKDGRVPSIAFLAHTIHVQWLRQSIEEEVILLNHRLILNDCEWTTVTTASSTTYEAPVHYKKAGSPKGTTVQVQAKVEKEETRNDG